LLPNKSLEKITILVNANASKLLKEGIIEIYNLLDINELRIFLTMLVYPEAKNVYENG